MPLITPVNESITIPAGNVDTARYFPGPPTFVGMRVIDFPTVPTTGDGHDTMGALIRKYAMAVFLDRVPYTVADNYTA